MPFRIAVKLSDDRKQITIVMIEDEKPVAFTTMGANALEGFIELLSLRRSEMIPPVPDAPREGGTTLVAINPLWRAVDEELPEGRTLALRHPGLGWAAFAFPPDEAKALADWFADQLPVSTRKSSKAN
jgi:hypothetical protein